VRDLRAPLPPAPASGGLVWRRLARADIKRLVASSPTLTASEVARRLREEQECWVGWLDATAVHWRWETRREAYLPYLHRHVRPLAGDRWVVEVYTHRALRGQGFYEVGSVVAMHRARDLGDVRLIGLIADWNRPARRVAEEKLGRVVVGSAGYWGLGQARRHFVTGDVLVDGEDRLVIAPPRRPPRDGLEPATVLGAD
jgi:hypothetical protein